jgi:tryptophan-rich sensory protein
VVLGLKTGEILKLAFFILLCQLAGGIGSYFTAPAIPAWYAALKKPFVTPPDWVFAPVWITLYVLIGIAAFLVWREDRHGKARQKAMVLFGTQLALNALWSLLFFGFRSPLAGLVGILVLTACVFLTLRLFIRISYPAGVLLIPYLLWTGFAAGLNFSIYLLNC